MCHENWLLPLLCVGYCHALIVPQEIPSILSLIFSTIPQVKKGTDSRFGFGFRLGEHADIQVLLELGPQNETRPIGPDSLRQGNSKRNVNQYDYDQGGTTDDDKTQSTSSSSSSSNRNEGENWLKNWSNGMQIAKRKKQSQITMSSIFNNENDNYHDKNNEKLIKVIPLISESALKQLQILYGKNSTSDEQLFMENANNKNINDTNISSNSGNLGNLQNYKNNFRHYHHRDDQQMTPRNKDQITAELSDVTMDKKK